IRLFCGLCHCVHRDVLAGLLAVVESDAAGGKREQGVILADADIDARVDPGPALAHDDVAADHFLAAELLHAEATARAVATVAGGTACLFMCHLELPSYFFSAGFLAAGFLAGAFFAGAFSSAGFEGAASLTGAAFLALVSFTTSTPLAGSTRSASCVVAGAAALGAASAFGAASALGAAAFFSAFVS